MLIDAIGDMLPIATAIALSPLPIIGAVLIVGGRSGRAAGPAFTAGLVLALLALSLVMAFLVAKIGESGSAGGPLLNWLRVGLGLLLLWAAWRQWQTRPTGDIEPVAPKWLAGLGETLPPKAFVLGITLCISNPKVIGLMLAAMSSLAYLQLASAEVLITLAVFALLCALPVIAIVLAHRFGGAWAAAGIVAVERFMLRNSNVIVMVVLIVLGMVVLGNGIAGFNDDQAANS